jgi:hypothetical protein
MKKFNSKKEYCAARNNDCINQILKLQNSKHRLTECFNVPDKQSCFLFTEITKNNEKDSWRGFNNNEQINFMRREMRNYFREIYREKKEKTDKYIWDDGYSDKNTPPYDAHPILVVDFNNYRICLSVKKNKDADFSEHFDHFDHLIKVMKRKVSSLSNDKLSQQIFNKNKNNYDPISEDSNIRNTSKYQDETSFLNNISEDLNKKNKKSIPMVNIPKTTISNENINIPKKIIYNSTKRKLDKTSTNYNSDSDSNYNSNSKKKKPTHTNNNTISTYKNDTVVYNRMSFVNQLLSISELKEKGLLTEDEFVLAKQKILNSPDY